MHSINPANNWITEITEVNNIGEIMEIMEIMDVRYGCLSYMCDNNWSTLLIDMVNQYLYYNEDISHMPRMKRTFNI